MTHDTWHVTHDRWGRWTFSKNLSSIAHTVWEWRFSSDISRKEHWLNELINHKGVCRKSLAAPSMLRIRLTIHHLPNNIWKAPMLNQPGINLIYACLWKVYMSLKCFTIIYQIYSGRVHSRGGGRSAVAPLVCHSLSSTHHGVCHKHTEEKPRVQKPRDFFKNVITIILAQPSAGIGSKSGSYQQIMDYWIFSSNMLTANIHAK